MIQRCKPEGYTPEELEQFIKEWNEMCDQEAPNPFLPSFRLKPSSKFLDDGFQTAQQKALATLTVRMKGDRRAYSRSVYCQAMKRA